MYNITSTLGIQHAQRQIPNCYILYQYPHKSVFELLVLIATAKKAPLKTHSPVSSGARSLIFDLSVHQNPYLGFNNISLVHVIRQVITVQEQYDTGSDSKQTLMSSSATHKILQVYVRMAVSTNI